MIVDEHRKQSGCQHDANPSKSSLDLKLGEFTKRISGPKLISLTHWWFRSGYLLQSMPPETFRRKESLVYLWPTLDGPSSWSGCRRQPIRMVFSKVWRVKKIKRQTIYRVNQIWSWKNEGQNVMLVEKIQICLGSKINNHLDLWGRVARERIGISSHSMDSIGHLSWCLSNVRLLVMN